MVLAVMVALTPGGFPVLLSYIAVRTIMKQWKQAQARALASGGHVSVRAVLSEVHFKDLVREARAAL
jgi:hypothetical protein